MIGGELSTMFNGVMRCLFVCALPSAVLVVDAAGLCC